MSSAASHSEEHGLSEKDTVVAKAEILSLKPTARVYEKRSNLFFRVSREEAIQHLDAKTPPPKPKEND